MLLALDLFVNTSVFVVLMLRVAEVCVVGVLDRGGTLEVAKKVRFSDLIGVGLDLLVS